ncbi:MAG: glycosyltransferase [Gemmatimonadota bacterium]
MHVVQYMPAVVPPVGYGGTERDVYWLARELLRRGHRVTVLADGRSTIAARIPGVSLVPVASSDVDYRLLLPRDADVVHLHHIPRMGTPDLPYMVTEHGNRRRFRRYPPNTVFVSKSHARNHNAPLYVYLGVPKNEYRPRPAAKRPYMLFMAKLDWKKKNAKTAIDLSFDADCPLILAGGKLEPWKFRQFRRIGGMWILRAPFKRGLLTDVGIVAGATKLKYMQEARLLFYLANWQEPGALAVLETLSSGTPILASPNGVFPEYIEQGRNGFIVWDYASALETLRNVMEMDIGEMSRMAEYCHATALSIEDTTTHYLALYERVIRETYLYPPEMAREIRFMRPPYVTIRR